MMVVTNRAHQYSASGLELKREVTAGAGGDKRPIQVRQVRPQRGKITGTDSLEA